MVVFNQKRACKQMISVNIRSGSSVTNVRPVFSFDSQYVIVSCGSDLKVFAIKSGECIQTLKYHSRSIISIKENKSNDLQVFSCSDDGVIVRWDYIDGKVLQVYNLHMAVLSFYVPNPSGSWFVTKKYKDHYRLYSFVARSKGCAQVERIMSPVLPKENSISFGFMAKFCASVCGNTVTIYKFDKKSIIRHKTGERNLTCIVCHPSEDILATGDDQGRVLLWSNALESNHPIRSIYHWHTLPVADLAFSSEGSHLYSGGGEAALVKWNTFSEEKFILPRMGAPIVHISVSRDNRYLVTAHHDNALQVFDSQRNIVAVIQGLTRCRPQNGPVLPTGLLYNSHLEALVMNGKPGHLQFYDLKQDKQLFNLDIAGKNLISQERDSAVFNIDVQKAAIDSSGLWLATSEYWSSGDTSPQIWLKFWLFDLEKQTFVLNTNVLLPHNKELGCILFRPLVEHSPVPLAVTTSADGRFKIWTLTQNPSDGKHSWSCESMGCYHDLSASNACFSEEGSLLAVAFESVATLWNVEGTVLKAVLCNEHSKKDLKQLLFGHHACCQYLVCQDGLSITVWNVLTLSIVWIVQNEVQWIAADPSSTHFAAFCKNQNLIIFTPDSPNPIHSFKTVSESPILSSIFVPFRKGKDACFHVNSELFFINEDQNLFTVSEPEAAKEVSASKKKMVSNIVETPFGMLQAAHHVSHVKKVESEHLSIIKCTEENNVITNLNQNALALCSTILPSLLVPIKKEEENKDSSMDVPVTQEMECEDSAIICKDSLLSESLVNCKLKFSDFSFLTKSVTSLLPKTKM